MNYNLQCWQTAVRYFQACWIDFSAEGLQVLFADDVEFQDAQSSINGKRSVLDAYVTNYFSRVDIAQTEIRKFDLVPESDGKILAKYSIKQSQKVDTYASELYQATEELTFDVRGLIVKIERTRK